MKKRTYEVFGRVQSGEPIRSVGSVEAPDDSFATRYAEMFYDEEDWDLLFVVDRRKMLKAKGKTGHEYSDTGTAEDAAATAVVGESS